MDGVVGICDICGSPAKHTCSLCGKLVCTTHYNIKQGICTDCERGKLQK